MSVRDAEHFETVRLTVLITMDRRREVPVRKWDVPGILGPDCFEAYTIDTWAVEDAPLNENAVRTLQAFAEDDPDTFGLDKL